MASNGEEIQPKYEPLPWLTDPAKIEIIRQYNPDPDFKEKL